MHPPRLRTYVVPLAQRFTPGTWVAQIVTQDGSTFAPTGTSILPRWDDLRAPAVIAMAGRPDARELTAAAGRQKWEGY